jgi:large subunit ribosomal protein L17
MRHQKAHRKFGRPIKHRMAMLKNLAGSVILYEKVETTETKAKEVSGMVDKLITRAKTSTVHDRRTLLAFLHNNELVVQKLVDVLGPRYVERTGGYTRIVKTGFRDGDNAPMAQISLITEAK